MEDDREEQIRQRAYTIWEEQGRPYGEDMRHWLRAWQEILDSNVAPEDAAVPALSDAGAEAVEPSPTSFNTVAAVAKGRKKKSNR